MFDFDHPWFKPLWRRLLVVGATLGWGVVEALTGAQGWAMLFGAAGAFAAYGLLLTYPKE